MSSLPEILSFTAHGICKKGNTENCAGYGAMLNFFFLSSGEVQETEGQEFMISMRSGYNICINVSQPLRLDESVLFLLFNEWRKGCM